MTFQDTCGQSKWYYKPWGLIIALLCVGPFALPLVWRNAKLSHEIKIGITIVMIVATAIFLVLCWKTLCTYIAMYQVLS